MKKPLLLLLTALMSVSFLLSGQSIRHVDTAAAATKSERKKRLALCRKKYGRKIFTTEVRNGKLICLYRKKARDYTREEILKLCKEKYYASPKFRVYKINGKWKCEVWN